MKKAEELTASKDIEHIKVYVLAKNTKATNFYHKAGYRDYEIGLIKEP